MKFKPQCKTRADLHREWARVLDMCEGTEARPEEGWKIDGNVGCGTPALASELYLYEFSIGIVEGKHVFRGDTLCFNSRAVIILDRDTDVFGRECFVIEAGVFKVSAFSINHPKQEPVIYEGFTKWAGDEKLNTVMVELDVEYVKWRAGKIGMTIEQAEQSGKVFDAACRKALDGLK